ncbi:hypothetical protein P9112_004377 [Eukaryota sp. TZLM1-RC]
MEEDFDYSFEDEGFEDMQPLSEPILPRQVIQSQYIVESPDVQFSSDHLTSRLHSLSDCRVVSFVGPLHSGKSTLIDHFACSSFHRPSSYKGPPLKIGEKWTDARKDEHERLISIKSQSITIPTSSCVLSLLDTPGHPQFMDEVQNSTALSDGVVLVIDAAEGVTHQVKRILVDCCSKSIPMVLALNKIDRIMLELRMPPNDCYLKLAYIIHQVNKLIFELSDDGTENYFDPRKNNVVFSSGYYEFCFTLADFDHVIRSKSKENVQDLSHHLWGDVYYDVGSNLITPNSVNNQRTFVLFCLEPLYKLVINTLSISDAKVLRNFLKKELGIKLSAEESKLDFSALMKVTINKLFKRNFVDVFADVIRSKIPSFLTFQSKLIQQFPFLDCRNSVFFTKIFPNPDGVSFSLLSRVIKGSIMPNLTLNFQEQSNILHSSDLQSTRVKSIAINQSRFSLPISTAPLGSLVSISLQSNVLNKNLGFGFDEGQGGPIPLKIFKYLDEPVIKLPIEPLLSTDTSQMISALQILQKYYPLLKVSITDNNDYSLSGPGELYLDCALKDLREFFGKIEVRVTDPMVEVRETITDKSSFECVSKSVNEANTVSMVAEMIEKEVADVIRSKVHVMNETKEELSNAGWDELTVDNIWSFGPVSSFERSNTIINETMVTSTGQYSPPPDDVILSIIKGFDWAVREGPLTGAPITSSCFRLLLGNFAQTLYSRSSVQIIPLIKKACHGAFLTASPRLMEPVFAVEFITTEQGIGIVNKVLKSRRGHVISTSPQPGTPLTLIEAMVPVLDSFGLEIDVGILSRGSVSCSTYFSHFAIMEGDPLDNSIELPPLEKMSVAALARDVMVKTRRRKGLEDDLVLSSYFDLENIESME